MISVDGLGVRAGGNWLFRGVDCVLEPGQCLALTGANGSGKSTLLRCLYGMRAPSEGTVLVGGRIPDERDRAFRRSVSVLLDDSEFFVELTPVQHLELLAGSFELTHDIEFLLDDAGLAERAEVTAGGLSAGQRRRLLLLAATARPCDVLLLDEPERALDADGQAWLSTLIGRATDRGVTVVLATHLRHLLGAADRIVELS